MTILDTHPDEHVDNHDDDVTRIRCPDCGGVSMFAHRDGNRGGVGLVCHWLSCPTLGGY